MAIGYEAFAYDRHFENGRFQTPALSPPSNPKRLKHRSIELIGTKAVPPADPEGYRS